MSIQDVIQNLRNLKQAEEQADLEARARILEELFQADPGDADFIYTVPQEWLRRARNVEGSC